MSDEGTLVITKATGVSIAVVLVLLTATAGAVAQYTQFAHGLESLRQTSAETRVEVAEIHRAMQQVLLRIEHFATKDELTELLTRLQALDARLAAVEKGR